MTSKEALEQFLQSFLEKCKDLNDNDDMYYKYNLTSPYHIIKKDLEVLEILKPYLKQALEIAEYEGGIELRFKPIAFGFGKIMSLDFNFNDTPQIKNIQKVKEWLDDKQRKND